jgi:DNA-binding response OmpR family regulator
MRLLIIEDEKSITRFIRKGMEEHGFAVDVSHHGDEGLAMALATPYDSIILDIMLPGRDGLSVLKALREAKHTVPVLLLTARGDVSDRVAGLNLGADDYLSKPFAMDELVARVKALVRRNTGERLTFYRVADLHLCLTRREVMRNGKPIELTMREFSLLECLMRSPGQVFTRTQICERVWNYQFDPGTNLVDVYIQRLRRKLDDDDENRLIQTVRGIGYSIRNPEVPGT